MSDLPTKDEVALKIGTLKTLQGMVDSGKVERIKQSHLDDLMRSYEIIRSLAAAVPCDRCGGQGKQKTVEAVATGDGLVGMITVEGDCPDCKGSGKAYDLEVE